MSLNSGYRNERVPKTGKLIIECCDYVLRKHRLLGLFKGDVTDTRNILRSYKEQTGNSISFIDNLNYRVI